MKIVIALLAILFADRVTAAEITAYKAGDTNIVAVTGPLVAGDEVKFENFARMSGGGVVLLNSDGGALHTGIAMGRTIRRLGLATWVSTLHGRCASACGFAWLAGTPRFLDTGSLIGFHAAYISANGKFEVVGSGNALAGAYMREIGLSDRAIEYATTARPESMKWLTADDIRDLGLEVRYFQAANQYPIKKRPLKIPIPETSPRD